MKKDFFKNILTIFFMISVMLLPLGCGSGGGGSDSTPTSDTSSTSTTTQTDEQLLVKISEWPSDLLAKDNTCGTVIAQVTNLTKNPMEGLNVNFELNGDIGTINTGVVTNSNGLANASLCAESSVSSKQISIRANVDNKYFSEWKSVQFTANFTKVIGRAYDKEGNPIIGATVTGNSEYQQSTTTDNDGYYEIYLPDNQKHSIIISHPEFSDSYQEIVIDEGQAQVENDGLLISSKSSTAGHYFGISRTYESNYIGDDRNTRATISIPIQNNNSALISNANQSSADIAVEFFESEQILPVPLPNAFNYAGTFVDGQAPSVVVAIKPATLVLNTPAKLTLPNPDNIKDNYIIHYIPENHKWVRISSLDGTSNAQSASITLGGIYGIFFDEEEKNQFTTVQGYTDNPNSFVFIGDKVIKSNNVGFFSAKVCKPKTGNNVVAYVYDPSVDTSTGKSMVYEYQVDTDGNNNDDGPIDMFVANMFISADPTSIHADNKSSCQVTALLKNWNNNPVEGIEVTFSVSDGTILPSAKTDANGRATVSLFSSTKSQDIIIWAKSSTIEKEYTEVKFVDPPSAAPTAISIKIENSVIQTVAQDGFPNTATIIAYITDENNNPIKDGTTVTFTTTIGDLDINKTGVQASVSRQTSKGAATAILTSHDNSVGIATINVSTGNISETETIYIAPGQVNKIQFLNTQYYLVADGASQITVTALVTDENENPAIDGETIRFEISPDDKNGSLSSKTISTKNGKASVIYTTGSQKGTYTITAKSESSGATSIVSSNYIMITLENPPIEKIELKSDKLTLDPNESCTITARLKKNNGGLISYDESIIFSTNIGDIDNGRPGVQNIVEVLSHNGEATATLTSPTNIQGMATINATVGTQQSAINIQIIPGEVHNINLSASPETIKGDGKSESIIAAKVTDKYGNLVLDGEPIHFMSTDPAIDLTVSTINGIATYIYRSSKIAKTITIHADANNKTDEIQIYQTATLPRYMSLHASRLTVKSDNSNQSVISAIVKDEYNTVVPGVPVVFSANSGLLTIGRTVTDDQGKAETLFSSGTNDKSNQDATIQAQAENITKIIHIRIEGSSVNLSCDNTQLTKDGKVKAKMIVTVTDAGNVEVPEVPVALKAMNSDGTPTTGITLSIDNTPYTAITSLKTDTIGQVEIVIEGKAAGTYDLEVSALNATETQRFKVVEEQGYTISMAIPPNIDFIKVAEELEITIFSEVEAVVSTSIGSLRMDGSSASASNLTVAPVNDKITVYFKSENSGMATIQAYLKNFSSMSDMIKIPITQKPENAKYLTLKVQPQNIPLSIGGIKNSAEIIAKVLTEDGQIVGDANVLFTIENSTGGGEYIEPVSVFTNSSGEAKATFTSGTLSSDAQGVTVVAKLLGNNSINDHTIIRITGTVASMSIGLGTESKILNPTTYATPVSIIVSDSNGNRMPNVPISLGLWPERYYTGYWSDEPDCKPVSIQSYPNEDIDKDFMLDSGEDLNNDGQLTPSSSAAGNVESSVITDENGVANFDLTYLKTNAVWIQARLEASAIVQGSGTTEVKSFRLPYVISDACFLDSSPFHNPTSVNPVETIELSMSTNSIIADGRKNTVISAKLLDHNGNTIKNSEEVIFSSTGGCLARYEDTVINNCVQELNVTYDASDAKVKLFSAQKIGNASVTVTAKNGVNKTTETISFIPGPPNRIYMVPSATTLFADGQSTSSIRVNILDETGNPVADGETIQMSVHYGSLNIRVAQTKESLVTFEYLVPSSITAESIETITVTTTNGISKPLYLTLKPAPISTISMASSDVILMAGEICSLTASLQDATGQLISNDVMVTFKASIGDIDASKPGVQNAIMVKAKNGTASTRLKAPTNILGSIQINASVDNNLVTTETELTIIPGPIATIHLTATPDILEADGKSESMISATATDKHGNLVADGESIRFLKTGGGYLSAPGGSTLNGLAVVQLIADASASMVSIVATSESGDISDTVFISISRVFPSKMSISTTQTTVKSDNSDEATISVIVLDENNFVLPGVKVFFNASGGQLKIISDTTDENGKANAIFSSGTVDRKNHTVAISANINGLSPVQIPIRITGSVVSLEADNTNITVLGSSSQLTQIFSNLQVTVKDAGGVPVYNTPITFDWDQTVLKITDASGEVLPTSIRNTDTTGQYTCKVEGLKEDEVNLRISALNFTAEKIYKVSSPGNAFAIISPDSSPYQLSVETPLAIQVMARPAGVTTVVFSASIGEFENNENVYERAVPQGEDIVQTFYQASMAGLTTIQVYDKYRQHISDSLKVAVTQPTEKAGKLLLQSNALVIPLSNGGTLNSVTLKATVLTSNNQVVGNAPVVFTILNPTGGGESISPVIAFTNETGVAETILTSGSLSSGSDGVNIRAAIVGQSSITDSVKIVIGGVVGSISIGVGTEVQDINSTTYSLPMSILVSDANGNSVPGAVVTLGTWPTRYNTGVWGANVVYDNEGKIQTLDPPCRTYITGTFDNEDRNKNLLMDESEDLNHDGQLTPPNSSAGNLPATVITDTSGVANFNLVYLKMNGIWIESEISASTIVHGTETLSTVSFHLPVALADVCHLSSSPYEPPDDGTLAGQIEKIILSATPDTLIADGRSKSIIKAIVTDEEGYPVVDGELIRFVITEGKGTISSTSTSTSSGQASIVYTAPSNGTSATRAVITASSSSGSISKTVIVSLIPAYIEMNAIPPNIPADGTTQSLVSAVLKNGKNNPVIGEEVKFSTSLGIIQSSAMTDEFGKATAILVSSKTYGTAVVIAEYCGYTQTLSVVFEKLPADPIPAKVSLSTSQISVKSDNLEQAKVTAIVLDKYNSVLSGINVIFRASDGQLSVSLVQTDEDGKASTFFTSGSHDKTNRTVTITAETGGLTPVQIPIVITGSSVELNADNSSITLPSTPGVYTQISATLEINISDAGGQGVFNTPILLTWEGNGDIDLSDPLGVGILTGNGFKLWSSVTGQASVIVTGKQPGSVVITARALGATASKRFNISAPGFAFGIVSPTIDPQPLEVDQPLNVIVRGGSPGIYTVVFSTTSGVFENNEAVINKTSGADGLATAVFHSDKAGMATIQVFNEGNYDTSDSIKVAIYQPIQKADKILLQSSSSSVPISNGDTKNTITIRATIITDYTSNNQVVGKAPVIFSIINPTGGGEYVSPVIAYTDESGVATTRFTSGSLGSTADGVIVEAAILNLPGIKEQIKIVIGGVAGSVAIGRGTSNDIVTVGTSAYALPMSVLVADANGNRIAGALVSLNAWPSKYHTGYWKANVVYDHSGAPYTLDPPCLPVRTSDFPNEDINENLYMDQGEDTNNDGELTPPNSAAGNLPSTVMTDENGVANFDLIYLKGSASWVTNRIQASTFVHGTETVSSITFVLPYFPSDVCNLANSPFVNFTGAVSSIKVTASQSYLIAGHDCIISALIKDDEGKLVNDGTTVYFVSSGGDINDSLPGIQPTFSADTFNGIASAKLVSPLDDLSTIEVTVRAGDFTDNIYIDVVSVPPAKMSLSTSKIAVNSDNSDHTVITAIVLDENNSVLPGVNVSFHTSSGQLSSGYAPTDADGTVKLNFSSGTYDRSNRTATITAKAEGLTPVQIPILITGSTIEMISEKTNLTVDPGTQDYSPVTDLLKITVLDSGNKPVFGTNVLITVENTGNRNIDLKFSETVQGQTGLYTSIFATDIIKTATIKTDVLGQAKLRVVGTSSGQAVVRATALGASALTNYKVSLQGEEFGIIYPSTDIHSAFVDEPLVLTVRAGAGNVTTVVFSTTSGSFDISENNVVDILVVNGYATATLESNVAGLATIQVYDKNNYQTSDSLKVAFSQPKNKADEILFQSSASSLPVSIGNIENT
ncbi:MAG: Ig-like domain-containing protein, partial [Candidatus Magnetomorum sp.]|nr:Ig-like domain-containing protein [Candidatus Magnetomorum sp.]